MDTLTIATCDTHTLAEDAIRELQRPGSRMKRLSIIGKGYCSGEHPLGFCTVGDPMMTRGGPGAITAHADYEVIPDDHCDAGKPW